MSDNINYHLVYPDRRNHEEEPSGGYVEVHSTHASHEAERNIETTIILAKLGYQIRLKKEIFDAGSPVRYNLAIKYPEVMLSVVPHQDRSHYLRERSSLSPQPLQM